MITTLFNQFTIITVGEERILHDIVQIIMVINRISILNIILEIIKMNMMVTSIDSYMHWILPQVCDKLLVLFCMLYCIVNNTLIKQYSLRYLVYRWTCGQLLKKVMV